MAARPSIPPKLDLAHLTGHGTRLRSKRRSTGFELPRRRPENLGNGFLELLGLKGTFVIAASDIDRDGVLDGDDKCPGTVDSYASQGLKPGHYDSSNLDLSATYGCSLEQILFCKPGANTGELRWGITPGTYNTWINQIGWSLDCQIDGVVALDGESKPLFENTDNEGMIDMFTADNDGDGVLDGQDVEPESKQNNGKPDWWCDKHPTKC